MPQKVGPRGSGSQRQTEGDDDDGNPRKPGAPERLATTTDHRSDDAQGESGSRRRPQRGRATKAPRRGRPRGLKWSRSWVTEKAPRRGRPRGLKWSRSWVTEKAPRRGPSPSRYRAWDAAVLFSCFALQGCQAVRGRSFRADPMIARSQLLTRLNFHWEYRKLARGVGEFQGRQGVMAIHSGAIADVSRSGTYQEQHMSRIQNAIGAWLHW
jgi:hypothetical protein